MVVDGLFLLVSGGWVEVDGGISWVCGHFLWVCEGGWTFFMGGCGWVVVGGVIFWVHGVGLTFFGLSLWVEVCFMLVGVCGHFLWVCRCGWGWVEVFLEWVDIFLWMDGGWWRYILGGLG